MFFIIVSYLFLLIYYADDTVLINDIEAFLQHMPNKVFERSKEYGLNINIRKTKVMVISKTRNSTAIIFVNGLGIEQVSKFKYEGC